MSRHLPCRISYASCPSPLLPSYLVSPARLADLSRLCRLSVHAYPSACMSSTLPVPTTHRPHRPPSLFVPLPLLPCFYPSPTLDAHSPVPPRAPIALRPSASSPFHPCYSSLSPPYYQACPPLQYTLSIIQSSPHTPRHHCQRCPYRYHSCTQTAPVAGPPFMSMCLPLPPVVCRTRRPFIRLLSPLRCCRYMPAVIVPSLSRHQRPQPMSYSPCRRLPRFSPLIRRRHLPCS